MAHPKIRLRIPEDIATATNNPTTVPLTWRPVPGVITGPGHEPFRREDFCLLRDTLGAYIVTDAPALVRHALRLPASEQGIV